MPHHGTVPPAHTTNNAIIRLLRSCRLDPVPASVQRPDPKVFLYVAETAKGPRWITRDAAGFHIHRTDPRS